MAQIISGDWPIDPAATTGSELAALLNRLTAAVMSGNSGTARPPNITAGMVWTRANASGTFDLMLFRGSADTVLLTVSATGVITPAGTYTSTQIDNKINDAKNAVLAVSVQDVNAGGGIAVSGAAPTLTVAHADTSAVTNLTNSGGTVIQSLTFDTYGHVLTRTAINLDTRFYTQSAANARYLQLAGGTMTGTVEFTSGNLILTTGGTAAVPRLQLGGSGLVDNSNGLNFCFNGQVEFLMQADGGVDKSASAVVTRGEGDARFAARFPDVGSLGSYGLFRRMDGGLVKPGTVVAGSTLSYATAGGRVDHPGQFSETHPPGNWQCMGLSSSYDGTNDMTDNTTLYVRVSA
jgi:hypothetical protein